MKDEGSPGNLGKGKKDFPYMNLGEGTCYLLDTAELQFSAFPIDDQWERGSGKSREGTDNASSFRSLLPC